MPHNEELKSYESAKTSRTGQVKEVTSLANPIIKDLRSLSIKKYRDQQKVFMIEGLELIEDALSLGWSIKTLVVAKSAKGKVNYEQVAARCFARGGLVLEVPEKIMGSITRRDNPQPVMAIFEQQYHDLHAVKFSSGDVYIALDRVRDPGNLGTIIRTADAVGAKGVILVGDTTDPYSLETVRATMGSVFSVPLFKQKESDFLNWTKQFKGLVVGTHLKGSVDYRSVDYKSKPVVLLMGNEQQGLPDSLVAGCNKLVRIPQAGRADSLNLAIAAGIMLYEIRRDALPLEERAVS